LFLDEIGDMPLTLQSRLLRVLAEGEVMPVGASEPRRVRLRVISASHRHLPSLVATGSFREDLFYRLNTATLALPPLRERGDFGRLVARLLARRAGEAPPPVPTAAALARLAAHRWPGNVRELDNALAFAAALCEHGTIDVADLPELFHRPAEAVEAPPSGDATTLEAVLAACGGNVSEAARRLGVDRTTIHRRLRRRRARSA
ncbi:MAG: sigma 54-interacting transcriptional regulator, partial [Phyllobacteriaceae bacterium]|nr:sigma 54-interacting transcriptional regulator [Phyllobacteriaceae bacterium]